MSYIYIFRIVFTTIHHFWDFTAGREWWIYIQLGAHIACARSIIKQTLAFCNFLANRLFSKKSWRAAWIEDLNNILKYLLPAAIPFKFNYFMEESFDKELGENWIVMRLCCQADD